ncbi:MAG: hypothetical protein Q8T09_19665 [Candidatus Melainabacteria bacterium]|nr:hypothetical protein [Candidatus Melainabacteria bacterium]
MPQDDLDDIANALNRKLEKNANSEARWNLENQHKRTENEELQTLSPAELTKFLMAFKVKIDSLKKKLTVSDNAYREMLGSNKGYIGWAGIQFLTYQFEKTDKMNLPAILHIWVKGDATETISTGAYRCKPIFKLDEGGVRNFYWQEITVETTYSAEELANDCFRKFAKAIVKP